MAYLDIGGLNQNRYRGSSTFNRWRVQDLWRASRNRTHAQPLRCWLIPSVRRTILSTTTFSSPLVCVFRKSRLYGNRRYRRYRYTRHRSDAYRPYDCYKCNCFRGSGNCGQSCDCRHKDHHLGRQHFRWCLDWYYYCER
jgi:hypothetical protein